MADAYQYFSGLPPLTGNRKSRPTTRTTRSARRSRRRSTRCPAMRWPASTPRPYNSPLQLGSCAGNYIIYISNGPVQDNNADNVTATTWLTTAASAAGVTRRDHADPDLADRFGLERGRRVGAVHAQEPAQDRHLHDRRQAQGHRPDRGLDGAAAQHGQHQRRQVLRCRRRQRRLGHRDRPRHHFLGDPGRQQRVRLGQPAGERQPRRQLPEPAVHRHVPARPRCAAALGRQPEAVQARHRRRSSCARSTPTRRRRSTARPASSPSAPAASGRRPPRTATGPSGRRAAASIRVAATTTTRTSPTARSWRRARRPTCCAPRLPARSVPARACSPPVRPPGRC